MVNVEFRAARKGVCQWCRKDRDEVFDVAFGDKSFVGMMCKADLFRAIGMKLPIENSEPKSGIVSTTTVPVSTGPPGK
jgi:hypothetical protein